MSCDKYKELISVDLDGELNKEEQEVLEKHLSDCAECRRFAGELNKVRSLAVSSEVENIPIELERKILAKTVHMQKKKSIVNIFKGYYRIPRGLVWAGALALVLLTVNSFIETDKTIQPTPQFTVEADVEADPDALVIQKVKLTEKDMVSSSSISKQTNGI